MTLNHQANLDDGKWILLIQSKFSHSLFTPDLSSGLLWVPAQPVEGLPAWLLCEMVALGKVYRACGPLFEAFSVEGAASFSFV